MQWYSDHRHGSARWADRASLSAAGLYARRGVFLGLCPFTGQPLTLESDAPLTLIGGSGSGKGATILLYNNFFYGAMLVHDPKAEIGAMIAPHQRAMGKDFYCINPCGLHMAAPWHLPQHQLNPFDILGPDSPSLVSDCKRIAAMFHEIDPAGKSFFPQRARQWAENLLRAFVLTFEQPTLPAYVGLVNMIESDFEAFKELAEGPFTELNIQDITRTCREIVTKRKSAPEEWSGVVSTIIKDMSFMSDPQLQRLFGGADFSLSVLTRTEKPCVVDIAFPAENLAIWSKALRLIIGVAMLYQQRAPGARPLFLIDEAAQLGHFEELERSYTYGRSFYRTMAVFQDIGQIEKHYGKPGVQTFLGSSQARIFIGVRDLDTARLCSDMLGSQTLAVENPVYTARARLAVRNAAASLFFAAADPFQVAMEMSHHAREMRHRDKIGVALLTPDQVLTLPENRALVFLSGLDVRPVMAGRIPYFQNPHAAGAFLPNPYHV